MNPVEELLSARRQRAVTVDTDHRPWPLPDRRWTMGQTWESLLFAHWPVPAEELRRIVPAPLSLDSFDGQAWLGITPFVVRGLRLRATLPLPYLSSFPEINVRTYVTVADKPGIYFLSLDAARRLAVFGARRTYRLPYFHAAMTVGGSEAEVDYSSRRISSDGPQADFRARYRAAGATYRATAGSLDHWLTERYCLYTIDERRRVWRGEIHHPPWALQRARAQIERNTMAEPFGVELIGEPLLHYAPRQDVALWPLARADASDG